MATVLIAGANPHGRELARRLLADGQGHRRLLGFVDDRGPDRLPEVLEAPLLGRFADVGNIVQRERVDEVFLALPISTAPRVQAILTQLRDSTASVHFIPQWPQPSAVQVRMTQVAGLPVLTLCASPFVGLRAPLKRAADVLIALIAIALTGPLMLGIAAAIKLTMPGGPVIFRQRRHGLNGQTIEVWKFRTMRVTEDGGSVRQATRNDPRVTPLGAFLRRTSLDELPQFFNVLQGRMSVIGPRPHALAHNAFYRQHIDGYMLRHKVRPGITGWAQVNGARGETDTLDKMERRLAYDLEYLRTWSPALDVRILWRTVRQAVRSDGNAY